MELIVIRHAQSQNNAAWAAKGDEAERSPDPEITEIGHRQAQALADFLSNDGGNNGDHNRLGITHLYASLMTRAVQTGSYVAAAIGVPLQAWEVIHEWGGIYEADPASGEKVGLPGPNRDYFASRFPDFVVPDTLGSEGWWNRPYEPYDIAPRRARIFLEELLERHGYTEDRVAIVTHGGFSTALFETVTSGQRYLELPDGGRHIWYRKYNCSISRLVLEPQAVVIAGINDYSFMPADLVT